MGFYYGVIGKYLPIQAKPETKLVKYRILDNFLCFWFRFIYRQRTAIEMGNFLYVRETIHREIASYSGPLLERFFHSLLASSGQYNRIGHYWERGHANEIDLVAINDREEKLLICEVKRNRQRISLPLLQAKSARLLQNFPTYQVEFRPLSLEDAAQYLPGPHVDQLM